MKTSFDTRRRPVVDAEFRDYRPPRIPPPYRNFEPAPARVPSSHLAARYPEDLDKTPSCLERVEPPWRVKDGKRR